jgi:hypothetical protein
MTCRLLITELCYVATGPSSRRVGELALQTLLPRMSVSGQETARVLKGLVLIVSQTSFLPPRLGHQMHRDVMLPTRMPAP